MEEHVINGNPLLKKNMLTLAGLCASGIALNVLLAGIIRLNGLPIYCDTVGTIVVSILGGYMPGIIVGLVSNFLLGIFDGMSMYHASTNIIIALIAVYMYKKGWLKELVNIIVFILFLSLISGSLSALITYFSEEFNLNNIVFPFIRDGYLQGQYNAFNTRLENDLLLDLIDKSIAVTLSVILLRFLPEKFKESLHVTGWQQKPLTDDQVRIVNRRDTRSVSMRTKILVILISALAAIALAAIVISYRLNMGSSIKENEELAKSVTSLMKSVVDPERVTDYMVNGHSVPGYDRTEEQLAAIQNTSHTIQYVYVYKIMEDGCHVVFDVDTSEYASSPGDVIPFDESFMPYVPALLAGEDIEPIISDDTYGYLLTDYAPLYDSAGNCQCYVATDISMHDLKADARRFLIKQISLFTGFFILTLAIGLWIAEYNLLLPVNAMAYTARTFTHNSDESMDRGLENIKELDITTGDEVENLYQAFRKMTEDNVTFVQNIEEQNELITRMQNGLILVLADMVESRDQNTGEHVRKTAAYTDIIMKHLLKLGYYTDELTEEFMDNVYNAAPLHDVGKINVPDAILNKPGKLTDEEYDRMKTHTTAGSMILTRVIDTVADSDYLEEAKRLAEYHHEKWAGGGYPHGIAGEEIPLSARIMAVADVFDALVSKRSYKDGMPFEKAVSIIEEGAGTHFDPKIAEAFLDALDEVREVAEHFNSSTPVTS